MQNNYRVSKWVYQRCLFSLEEFSQLVDELKPLFFPNGRIVDGSDLPYTKERLLKAYAGYLEEEPFPPLIMTLDPQAIDTKEVKSGKFIVHARLPVIQISEHQFIKGFDGSLLSMVYGKNSIRWGLQFAYPGLFIDPVTKKVVDVLKEESLPNTHLFKQLQRYLRYNTKPASFIIDGKKINATFRVGKALQELRTLT